MQVGRHASVEIASRRRLATEDGRQPGVLDSGRQQTERPTTASRGTRYDTWTDRRHKVELRPTASQQVGRQSYLIRDKTHICDRALVGHNTPLSGRSPESLRLTPSIIPHLLESSPPKSRILVRNAEIGCNHRLTCTPASSKGLADACWGANCLQVGREPRDALHGSTCRM